MSTLRSLGANLIPVNPQLKQALPRVLRCEQQGVLYGPKKRYILGVRHSEGNYADELDDMGKFTYQPPANPLGCFRYRFAENLAHALKVELIVLVIMWFKYELTPEFNHIFMIAPAKIVSPAKNMSRYEAVSSELVLQLVQTREAQSNIDQILSFNLDDTTVEARSALPDHLAREFAYDKVQSSEKGRMIKRWAQNHNLKCPGSTSAGPCDKKFADLSLSNITFGHIIFQHWGEAFPHLQGLTTHHPDNMYLTCKACNSSLNARFPDDRLRQLILSNGTIGDWLRKHEKAIRMS